MSGTIGGKGSESWTLDQLSAVALLSVVELGAAPSPESPQPISEEATDNKMADLKSDDIQDIPLSK
ncbi:MAG: hypothetical protein ACKVHE_29535 [Planctomycetales bacterium]